MTENEIVQLTYDENIEGLDVDTMEEAYKQGIVDVLSNLKEGLEGAVQMAKMAMTQIPDSDHDTISSTQERIGALEGVIKMIS